MTSVFALLLVPVGFELLVEQAVAHQLVLALALIVSDQQPVVIKEADDPVFDFEHHFFADHGMGQEIAIGLVGDQAVLVDLSEHLDGGVVVAGRQRP